MSDFAPSGANDSRAIERAEKPAKLRLPSLKEQIGFEAYGFDYDPRADDTSPQSASATFPTSGASVDPLEIIPTFIDIDP